MGSRARVLARLAEIMNDETEAAEVRLAAARLLFSYLDSNGG